jgi:hypothetical protein
MEAQPQVKEQPTKDITEELAVALVVMALVLEAALVQLEATGLHLLEVLEVLVSHLQLLVLR